MKNRLELHHFCYRIVENSLETVFELFEKLGFRLSYRPEKHRWAMIEQPGKNVSIQLVESDVKPFPTESKTSTHIALLSKNPATDIKVIEEWAKMRGLKFATCGWNERERWFDLPEIFIDFVVEVMDVKVVE